jgi:hypothetical protein
LAAPLAEVTRINTTINMSILRPAPTIITTGTGTEKKKRRRRRRRRGGRNEDGQQYLI